MKFDWEMTRWTRTLGYCLASIVIATTPANAAPFCPATGPLDCSVPVEKLALLGAAVGEAALPVTAKHYKDNFHESCVTHDYCYRFGAETYGLTRNQCDTNFLNDMRHICKSWDWWGGIKTVASGGLSKAGCFAAAEAFHLAVERFGSGAWNDSGNGSRFCEYHGPTVSCSSNTYSSCWTQRVSEEGGGEMSCPKGMAISGIWCSGGYCDNKNLQCSPFSPGMQAQALTKRISEEQPDSSFRTDTLDKPSVLTGIKCTGSYCDNITGKVGHSTRREVVVKTTGWNSWTSEEQRYAGCPVGEFVTGMRCKGSYCDEISLHCSSFNTPQVLRSDLVPDDRHFNTPLDIQISTIRHRSSGKFADAYGSKRNDYGAVIRPEQGNDTQAWKFIPVGNGEYLIQQRSTGRYLDAYRSIERDYDVVTRPKQGDGTQVWQLRSIGNENYTIRQKITGRYLDSHEIREKDFRMVTRPRQHNDSQIWEIRLH